MIANLFNIPDTQQSWDEYTFSLQASIRDINRRIREIGNILLPEYMLDPFNLQDPGPQSYNLQISMNNINAALGISGYDYVDVDLSSQGQAAGWVWLLANNLRHAANLVGLG